MNGHDGGDGRAPGARMDGGAAAGWEAVDAAILAGAEAAFRFLERLVAAPSTVGLEREAQELVAAELARIGFDVTWPAVPEHTAAAAPGGVAQASYRGRANVLGRLNPGGSPSLLLNGHVDVVPAEAELWSSDPFIPVRADGWLVGRGAGDMKGGLAMGLLTLAAMRQAMPDALAGELAFLSVIEEECTGNGTLAAGNSGVLGDAVVLLEPTGLDLLLGGVGVLWIEIEITGVPAHAEAADRAMNPVHCVPAILARLAELEDEINAGGDDPAFGQVARPYNVNVGAITAGDWASSVPARARLRVRVGFPRGWTPDQALQRAEAAVRRAGADDPWLAAHPPTVRPVGFLAEGYLLADDHPLAGAMADAHVHAHAVPPRRIVLGSTTDARYYINQFGRPALAYGPRARNIHAVDEAVDLASIVAGARTLARFIARFFAAGPAVPRAADGTGSRAPAGSEGGGR
jgi:acetylornithine deacetylase